MPYLDDQGVEYLVADIKEKTDAAYQPILVSGTNIKTVNNTSLLGSGNISIEGGATTTWYGTSSTAAGTAAKVVTCSGFALVKGAIVSVLFSTGNTAATPTLNVNSTGAKTIYVGSGTINSTTNVLKWSANTLITFIYDGTYYRFICATAAASVIPSRGAGSWYGTCPTSETANPKYVTAANFVRTQGTMISITFSAANTYVSGALGLNINSTGEYAVYVNNAVTSSGNPLTWDAGETLTFVIGYSSYHLISRSKVSVPTNVSAFTNDAGYLTLETLPIYDGTVV